MGNSGSSSAQPDCSAIKANTGQVKRFVIRPNNSMNAGTGVIYFVSLACLSFGIAGVFFFIGMWLILPFAGLEMAFLACVLYLCRQRSKRREVVTINDDSVIVSCGSSRLERRCLFKRAWAQVRLQAAPFRGHPRRLLIGSHGQHIEVGSYLSEPEKTSLANSLRETIDQKTRPAHLAVNPNQ